jgi:excisionase family DNA binding protein
MTSNEEKYLLTVEDVAAILEVSKMHVYRLIHAGKLPYIKVGNRSYRIQRGPFFKWLAGGLLKDDT